MESEILKYFITQGPFAVLFVALFVHQLRDSRTREDRLMKLSENLTERFEQLADRYDGLAEDVHEIKSAINGKEAA
ncbi:BhlA-like holin [Fontibacillus phaseoli]|uniref:BhlA-like holin n=1 Tax=Fontibacillus phaseoli TaxID=1416533 RepID=A0A369BMZ8_9BACL|nr:BhlA/UviB family holin-like peptide [Fontibacillus phaseoli]RCX22970.1 BhlA-like holin [Fontibacillus phaseoli]